MQLLNTDTEIIVQTKMSTTQQESLEKFTLNENVCSDLTDITNGADECVQPQEVVKIYEKNVEADELVLNRSYLNEKSNEVHEELGKIYDKESSENKENRESEDVQNIQFEEKDKVHSVLENDEIALRSDTLDEVKMEMTNDTDIHGNNSENKTEEENIQNCEMEQDKLNNSANEKNRQQRKEDIEMDVTFEEDNDKNSLPEDKIESIDKENSETNEILNKQNEEDIGMDVTFKEQDKVNNILTEDTFVKQNDEDIDMDVTYEEQNNVRSNSVTDNNIKGEVKKNSKIDEKYETQINEDNAIVDVTFEEREKVKNNNLTEDKVEDEVKETIEKADKFEKQDEVDIGMEVTFEEKENSSFTEDKFENEVKENSKKDDIFEIQNEDINVTSEKVNHRLPEKENKDVVKEVTEIEENEESIEHDVTFQDKVIKNLTEGNTKKEVRDKFVNLHNEESKNGDGLLEQTEIEIQVSVNNSVKTDKIEEHVKGTGEVDAHNENRDIQIDVTLEEPDTVNNSFIEGEIDKEVMDFSETEEKLEELKEIEIENNVNDSMQSDKVGEHLIGTSTIDDNKKMDITLKEQENNNNKEAEDKINDNSENLHHEKSENKDALKELKEVTDTSSVILEEQDNCLNEDNIKEPVKDNNEAVGKLEELCKEQRKVQNKVETQVKSLSVISDKFVDQPIGESITEDKVEGHDENSAINIQLEKTGEKDKEKNMVENKSQQKQSAQIEGNNITKLDSGSLDVCNINKEKIQQCDHVDSKKDIDENVEIIINHRQEFKIHDNENEKNKDTENKTNNDNENKTVDTEWKLEMQDSDEGRNASKFLSNSDSSVTQMDIDEVIDIADEKDDDIDQDISDIGKELENLEKAGTSVEILENALKSTVSVDVVSSGKSSTETSVQDMNVQRNDLNTTRTENVEKKRKYTHLSKLSNTLDILSDDEEDLLREEPQKDVSGRDEKQCTSINIDDDDDIMLIDEEPKSKNDKNKTENSTEPENAILSKEESKVESKDKEEHSLEISSNKKDTIQTEVTTPSVDEIKTSESKQEITIKEKTTKQKTPLVQVNFLKTCVKNIADMTRDELEEFCILKIVESVVDRSDLSEIKSQLKTMTQNIDEYKKKAALLTKQNRDLQVVLKSVQEEQKKKSNMPITPLKITRSVGMQVLMTDKVGVRKKILNPNTGHANAPSNSGTNRQAKTSQSQPRHQKNLTNTNSSPPIPVPRLVPAVNNSSSNNVKTLSPNVNTAGKSQATGTVINSPTQTMPNGLPVTQPVQKPEKRSHSRMQQSNSFTVDLTDDEPPTKLVSRNVTPPVRLVPPQNLLAPNRQPFGSTISNPRKVYIPISGSQTPVGVRPGQTIMLKTISPQGPRQRVPTPSAVKANQSANTVRMQRVQNRHPAPLPDSVKQYQPLNWKALPPAPELKLSKVDNGIVISWKIDGYQEENYEEIASYQLYAYQETSSPPSTTLWKKIGDVKALPLPMACTLTQFMAGFKYYFAVRAVDVKSRLGPFSLPGSILLLNKI